MIKTARLIYQCKIISRENCAIKPRKALYFNTYSFKIPNLHLCLVLQGGGLLEVAAAAAAAAAAVAVAAAAAVATAAAAKPQNWPTRIKNMSLLTG